MPGRILGLDFGRNSSTHNLDQSIPSATSNQTKSGERPLESRRPSMDKLVKRPGALLQLGKKHSSESKSKSKDRSGSRDKHASEHRVPLKPAPVKLNLHMESPPALMLDPPSQSSGVIVSGQLHITPNTSEVTLESCKLFLEKTTTTKRPIQDKCRDCITQIVDIAEWDFFKKPKTFKESAGKQSIPFSHRLPGNIPATTQGQLGSVEYSLHCRARTTSGEECEYRHELLITRAIRPGPDKTSVRIFPPTNLTLHVILPNIVHPIGEFPVQCRMTGITTKRDDTQTRWRLRKLTWRVEEHETMISPPCAEHVSNVGEGKAMKYENTRHIGMDELKQGWKTDFSEGQVDGEFMAHINPTAKPNCGMDTGSGFKIAHNLVLELVIAEEWAPNKKPENATYTGAARVLRTQFALNVTQRAGMGIGWDEEQPPMYDDVPASPPHYQNDHTSILNYEGEDLHNDIERLNLDGDETPNSSGGTITDLPESLPPSYSTTGGFSDPNFTMPSSSRAPPASSSAMASSSRYAPSPATTTPVAASSSRDATPTPSTISTPISSAAPSRSQSTVDEDELTALLDRSRQRHG
ncbi:hypothetical protein CLAFUW4_03912 [Fulvia fulva]|uniref:LDB19 N-terminal domain-containing protein n=1 Tax=Passalora fulva TaxID=5499 RepID=A0A9Q8LBJ9_PASFU|nr:uncharacterized protein CLAFUR5_03881 [Fulvia fulva]KAK4633618.1 hypothetical protein CLAFUR0_03899 [Fulvia fulva]UJO14403.1 hypothetical protein CLAFUR5_03881 [Fulvia fulva]WPV11932.1 hypothetical protein CLAFUW4_03912 [Fulvia fulva]